ncbi:MAG: hypoxanthine phosphoribosyltransferase [Desulfovibrionaceae bacterium]|nr:hypoxanthine phosphoribosyltransferase [Desulfovibrionaceae bacterium]
MDDPILRNAHRMRLLYDADSIARRVRELAAEIDALYKDEPLVMICVLKGAFMFFSDLVKNLTISPELDFVRLSSYGSQTTSSRSVSFTKDVESPLTDRHVLVIEDIVDSGRTMDFLLRQLSARGPRSLRLAALLDKKERREVPVFAHFVGFALPAGFIVGYGLDYAEHFRALPALYEIPCGE